MSIFNNNRAIAMAYALIRCTCMADVVTLLRETAATLPWCESKRKGARGWREEMLLLADALEQGRAHFAIISRVGNMKLAFASFSALPYVTCPGMGRCGLHKTASGKESKGFCYSRKAWRTPAGFLRQFQNTALLMFAPHVIAEDYATLDHGIEFRLYVDGDFANMQQMQFWFDLLNTRPDLQCYGYSKSWLLFIAWDDAHRPFPTNYALNLSSGSSQDGNAELVERMFTLPVCRNWFIAVEVDKRFMRKEKGYNRYHDPEYHRAVREAARKLGHNRVFSCTGNCNKCGSHGGKNAHVCGARKADGTFVYSGIVAIGNHA